MSEKILINNKSKPEETIIWNRKGPKSKKCMKMKSSNKNVNGGKVNEVGSSNFSSDSILKEESINLINVDNKIEENSELLFDKQTPFTIFTGGSSDNCESKLYTVLEDTTLKNDEILCRDGTIINIKNFQLGTQNLLSSLDSVTVNLKRTKCSLEDNVLICTNDLRDCYESELEAKNIDATIIKNDATAARNIDSTVIKNIVVNRYEQSNYFNDFIGTKSESTFSFLQELDNDSPILCQEYTQDQEPFSIDDNDDNDDDEEEEEDVELMLDEALIKEKIRGIKDPTSDFTVRKEMEELLEEANMNLKISNELDDLKENINTYEDLINRAIQFNRELSDLCLKAEYILLKRLEELVYISDEPIRLTRSLPVEETHRGFYSRFGMPYFKDQNNFYCPFNNDHLLKFWRKEFIGYTLTPSDILYDRHSVEEALREYLIEKYKNDNYYYKIKTVKERRSDGYFDKLRYLNKGIKFLKTTNIKYLLKGLEEDSINWEMVANRPKVNGLSAIECWRFWHLLLKPSLGANVWNFEDTRKLIKLASENNYQNWEIIAERLSSGKSGFQCFIQWKKKTNDKICLNKGRWSYEEDNTLKNLVKCCRQGDIVSWSKVLYYLEDRTMAQALNRWYRLDPNLKRGKFSNEEDILLENAIEQFGLNFTKIATVFENRSAVQLRERYFTQLDMKSNIKYGEWTVDEDKLLMKLVSIHGLANWSTIAEHFPNRNRIQIRHRYKCLRINFEKNPNLKIDKLKRHKRITHQNKMNKRNYDILSKNDALEIIHKKIEEGKVTYKRQRGSSKF